MSIYTRTGDKGQTSLFSGKRVSKSSDIINICGTLDELNSFIGLVEAKMRAYDIQEFLKRIQSDIFSISSHFAGCKKRQIRLNVSLREIEERIDKIDKKLKKRTKFIIPGGSERGALAHMARAICRRAERQVVKVLEREAGKVGEVRELEEVKDNIIAYLNRLSDLLFVLARFINKKSGILETEWNG